MEKLISEKAKIARESLDVSQSQAGRESKWSQARISRFESEKKELMPVRYLSWMAKNKINLTAMFDESVTTEDFKAICEGKVTLALPAHHERGPCPLCATKDHEIGLLNRIIKSQEDTIDALKPHTSL